MYCTNCGKEIDDRAVICPHCGVATGNYVPPVNNYNAENMYRVNTYAIVGFVLSFFVAIAGLVVSIIGLRKTPVYGGNGKGLAVAGIVISAVEMAVMLVYMTSLLSLFGILFI